MSVLSPKAANVVHVAGAGGAARAVSTNIAGGDDYGRPVYKNGPAPHTSASPPTTPSKPKAYPSSLSRDPNNSMRTPTKPTPTRLALGETGQECPMEATPIATSSRASSSKASSSSKTSSAFTASSRARSTAHEAPTIRASSYPASSKSPTSKVSLSKIPSLSKVSSEASIASTVTSDLAEASQYGTSAPSPGAMLTPSAGRDLAGTRSSSLRAPPGPEPLQQRARAASHGAQLPIRPQSYPSSSSSATDNEAEKLVAMLRGRSELEILRAFIVSDTAIQTLKGIIERCKPQLLRGLSGAELETLERATALLEFYWFTRELDVGLLSSFVGKVTYNEIRDIAEAPESDDEYATGDDSFVDAEAASQWADAVAIATSNEAAPVASIAVPVVAGFNSMFEEADGQTPTEACTPTDLVDSEEECATPPNETRVDPRTAYLDPETRELRRVGRRCASGAALLAAAKRALRDNDETDSGEAK